MNQTEFVERHGRQAWENLVKRIKDDHRQPGEYKNNANRNMDDYIFNFLKKYGFSSITLVEAEIEFQQKYPQGIWSSFLEILFDEDTYEMNLYKRLVPADNQ